MKKTASILSIFLIIIILFNSTAFAVEIKDTSDKSVTPVTEEADGSKTSVQPDDTEKTNPEKKSFIDKIIDFFKNIIEKIISLFIPNPMFYGYRYSDEGYYFIDDKDCWQKDVGYNELYDKWAPREKDAVDLFRVIFKYDNKYWLIQFSKGQYTFNLYGADIGIFTCEPDSYNGEINRFSLADKEDWLDMSLDVYNSPDGQSPELKLSRSYDKYWWVTGYVEGRLSKLTAPRTEVLTESKITFKTPEQANLFVQGLKQAGFVEADGEHDYFNSYSLNESDVNVSWHSANNTVYLAEED